MLEENGDAEAQDEEGDDENNDEGDEPEGDEYVARTSSFTDCRPHLLTITSRYVVEKIMNHQFDEPNVSYLRRFRTSLGPIQYNTLTDHYRKYGCIWSSGKGMRR